MRLDRKNTALGFFFMPVPNPPKIVTLQSQFDGISIEHIEHETPFFAAGVNEALALIASKPLGRALLDLVKMASPQGGTWGATVPPGTKVLIKPQANRRFMESGFKPDWLPGAVAGPTGIVPKDGMSATANPSHNVPARPFTYLGEGSCNKGNDTSCSSDKRGTLCELYFDSAQMLTSKGDATTPFIVLAHELIHSYHNLYGIVKGDGAEEEKCTTGLSPYQNDEFTENAFRKAFGMALRAAY